MIVSVSATYATPVFSAEKCSTCCMYSVSRKNCENSAPASSRPAAFEAASVRRRKMPSGSSGAFERSSITTKATTSAAEAASSPIVAAVAPAVLRRARHRVDEQHQPAGDRERARSVEVAVPRSARLSRSRNGVSASTRTPDRDVDEEDPRPAERARQRPAEQDAGRSLRCRRRRPRCRARGSARGLPRTSSSGSRAPPARASAAPRPCSARNAISEPSDHASPSSSEATVKRAMPATKSLRLPRMSARRPPSRSTPPKMIV